MTKEEIKEFNELCAEFLGYKNTTPTDPDFNIYENEKGMIIGNKIYTMLETMSMRFHSDWNWIMNVKDKITSLKIVDEFNTGYDSVARGFFCSILPAYKNSFVPIYTNVIVEEKEAVIQVIYQFLKWYKENQKL